jgi:hypothetical protein
MDWNLDCWRKKGKVIFMGQVPSRFEFLLLAVLFVALTHRDLTMT